MPYTAEQRLGKMDSIYLTEKRRCIYTACEDMNFLWDEADVLQLDHMWNEGLSVQDMAVAFDRDPDEVVILCMDRVRNGFIGVRRGGWMGNKRE